MTFDPEPPTPDEITNASEYDQTDARADAEFGTCSFEASRRSARPCAIPTAGVRRLGGVAFPACWDHIAAGGRLHARALAQWRRRHLPIPHKQVHDAMLAVGLDVIWRQPDMMVRIGPSNSIAVWVVLETGGAVIEDQQGAPLGACLGGIDAIVELVQQLDEESY